MSRLSPESSPHAPLRDGARSLARLALWVQLGCLTSGLGLFLDQAKDLISDAQFTWGERRVMAIVAVVTLGGCGLAGWILGQLLRTFAQALEVMADGAESSRRTTELIEQHLVPTLNRIALAIEGQEESSNVAAENDGTQRLRSELARAQAAGRVGRVFELRDQITQHVRGEALHAIDVQLAIWMLKLVEQRVQADRVNSELAGWVAPRLNSFGSMPEADPLRAALPSIRRRAGLCQRCGKPVAGGEPVCLECQASPPRGSPPRPTPERPARSSLNRDLS